MNTELLKEDFRFLILSATAALCIGLLLNQLRDEPLDLTYQPKEARLNLAVQRLTASPVVASAINTLPEALSLEYFSAYVAERKGIILDARPEIFHRLGHVPGALSLPREDFENSYRLLRDTLEQDRAQPIVIYCSSASCEDADLVRKALVTLGYTQLSVFEGGWAAWTQAGKPEERK